ncbi:MAG: hypothetical protein L6R36_000959 [Xanthoria steineri]|nr:MAG: hypothetical protein L6R36_000959 [Xanthoria steineri]
MPDHSPRVASTMLDCSLDLLTDPVHFYSAAYSSLAGLGDHISRTTLPWPDAMDDPALQDFSSDIFPPSVSAEAQIAHFGRDAIVDPHLLESIKVEDGYTSASSPEYDTASHLRSSSGVDSLVQTIQTKSERQPRGHSRSRTTMITTAEEHLKPINAALHRARKHSVKKATSKSTYEHTVATSHFSARKKRAVKGSRSLETSR